MADAIKTAIPCINCNVLLKKKYFSIEVATDTKILRKYSNFEDVLKSYDGKKMNGNLQ